MNNIQSISVFWPELIILITAVVVIGVDLLQSRQDSCHLKWWSLAGLVLTFWVLTAGFSGPSRTLFMGQSVFDSFGTFFKQLILIATALVLFIVPKYKEFDTYRMGEFYTLVLLMVFGMFLLTSAVTLIMVYLALEIVSISSFILAGYLKRDRRSNEAALKYIIYGAFSSGLMLFGFSLIFGITGHIHFGLIAQALAGLDGSANLALLVATILVLAGFGYKISMVPFHFWTPDVYEGAPTPITAFLSVAPKAAGFAVLMRFFHDVFLAFQPVPTISIPWPTLLGVLAVLTMTLGNLVAIQQTSVKRMLAYSSIAHAGTMLLGMPLLASDGYFGIMIYLVMYLITNLGAFFVVIAVSNKTGGESFDDFRELGWRMPLVGVTMTIFMISLTGLPPSAGFIGKFYIFAAIINAGSQYYWLAFIGILNSVISLYYYLRVVKVMYLRGDRNETLSFPSRTVSILLVCLAVPTLIFGIYWAPVSEWIRQSLLLFANTF